MKFITYSLLFFLCNICFGNSVDSIWSNSSLEKMLLNKGKVVEIRERYSSKSRIDSLINILGNFPNLKEIVFYNCDLRQLSSKILDAQTLELIETSYCKLDNIEILYGLKNLKVLFLSNDSINFLPNGISKLKNLENLNLSHNNISTMPEDVNKLEHLRVITLSYNKTLKQFSLPKNLMNLTMEDCNIQNIDWILKNINPESLVSLNLASNAITQLPEELDRFTKLKSLLLMDNNINRIDCSFTSMKLTFLMLHNNLLDDTIKLKIKENTSNIQSVTLDK